MRPTVDLNESGLSVTEAGSCFIPESQLQSLGNVFDAAHGLHFYKKGALLGSEGLFAS